MAIPTSFSGVGMPKPSSDGAAKGSWAEPAMPSSGDTSTLILRQVLFLRETVTTNLRGQMLLPGTLICSISERANSNGPQFLLTNCSSISSKNSSKSPRTIPSISLVALEARPNTCWRSVPPFSENLHALSSSTTC